MDFLPEYQPSLLIPNELFHPTLQLSTKRVGSPTGSMTWGFLIVTTSIFCKFVKILSCRNTKDTWLELHPYITFTEMSILRPNKWLTFLLNPFVYFLKAKWYRNGETMIYWLILVSIQHIYGAPYFPVFILGHLMKKGKSHYQPFIPTRLGGIRYLNVSQISCKWFSLVRYGLAL